MAIKVGAGSLTIEDVVKVARQEEKIELRRSCVSSFVFVCKYSLNTGTNEAESAPSPKRRRNKFGILYAA